MEEYNYNLLLGNVVTAIFMIIACYFGTIKFHQTQAGICNPLSIDDFIPVGYIEESPTVIGKPRSVKIKPTPKTKTTHNINKKQPQTTKKPAPAPRNNDGFTELQQDCYDALKGLKVTAKEARYLIHTIFNKHNPKTIQDFLQLAFVRGK